MDGTAGGHHPWKRGVDIKMALTELTGRQNKQTVQKAKPKRGVRGVFEEGSGVQAQRRKSSGKSLG